MIKRHLTQACTKNRLAFITVWTIFLILAAGISSGTAWAVSSYTTQFNNYYGTSGTRGGTSSGSCITCHNTVNGSGVNSYGRDWSSRSYDFAAVESLDSDGDGFDNITEILADSSPGNAADTPPPATTNPPVANAGADRTVNANDTVTLDGSLSYDPDGSIVAYQWSQTGGATVTLSNPSSAQPTFTAPQVAPGTETLTFSLRVTDNAGLQSSDTCIVTVNRANSSPVADAGIDQTVETGVTVTLDGSNSADPDGDIASYLWTQVGGTTVNLSDSAAMRPTFTSPNTGSSGESLSFQLTVTDSFGLTSTDTCIVNVTAGNLPPVADAGIDQDVNEGATVTLDGTGSSDPDGSVATYQWTQTGGPAVSLSNPSAASPTFTAPDIGLGGAALTFRLTVVDNLGLQASDTCIVNVAWINMSPVADAGSDLTGSFSIEEGATVVLDGTNSSDADDGIASYRWEQIGTGPAVTLSDPTAAQPTFVTPIVDAGDVTLTFRLTVQDNGGLQSSDDVLVTVFDNGIAGFPAEALTTMSSTGLPIGVTTVSGGSITRLEAVDPATLPGVSEIPGDMTFGLLDLDIKTDSPGAKVTITVYLTEPAPDGYKWYKYDSRTNIWTDYGTVTDAAGDTGAVFNAARDQVTLTLVDGGMGDDDDQSNAVIKDPSGLGSPTLSVTSSGTGANDFGGGGGGGCFIEASTSGNHRFLPAALLIAAIWLTTAGALRFIHQRRQKK